MRSDSIKSAGQGRFSSRGWRGGEGVKDQS